MKKSFIWRFAISLLSLFYHASTDKLNRKFVRCARRWNSDEKSGTRRVNLFFLRFIHPPKKLLIRTSFHPGSCRERDGKYEIFKKRESPNFPHSYACTIDQKRGAFFRCARFPRDFWTIFVAFSPKKKWNFSREMKARSSYTFSGFRFFFPSLLRRDWR